MAYPNEVNRFVAATASGTAYTDIEVLPFGVADDMRLCIPAGVEDGDPVVLVIGAHGWNATENMPQGAGMVPIRDGILDRGWLLASAFAHGDQWYNQTALDDYRRVYDWVDATWNVTDVLLIGLSMGGATVVSLYSRDSIPKVRAAVGIDSALSLGYAHNKAVYQPSVRAAYGIAANGSDYAARTAGYDPLTFNASTFDGKRLFLSASPADTSIPPAQNTTPFVDRITGHPAVLELYTGAGTHLAPGNHAPSLVLQFFDDAVAGTVPDAVIPAGIVEVEAYALVDGELMRIDI
jgi:pimeloyl-ACP methyl ester carboxylesterase